jgi:hypothetical protein
MRLLGAERRSDRSDILLVGCKVLEISGKSVAIGGFSPLLLFRSTPGALEAVNPQTPRGYGWGRANRLS